MGYERNDRRYGSASDRYGYGGQGSDRGRYGGGAGDYGQGRRDYRGDRSGGYGERAEWRDRDSRDDDRGFFDRAGDEVRSWFGDEDAERRRRQDERDNERDYRRRYGTSGQEGRGYEPAGDPGFAAGVGLGGGFGGPEYAPGGDYYAGNPGRRRDFDRGEDREQRTQGHDHTYRSWRDRQMAAFDRDYDEYRRENQGRFDAEFRQWREQRQGQREHLRGVKEHQEVVGSDGTHIGTVDHVRGDRILLTKTDQAAGGHHHSIPCSWIQSVDDKVTISKSADEAKQAWRDEERGEGSAFGWQGDDKDRGRTNLNRSFSGTY